MLAKKLTYYNLKMFFLIYGSSQIQCMCSIFPLTLYTRDARSIASPPSTHYKNMPSVVDVIPLMKAAAVAGMMAVRGMKRKSLTPGGAAAAFIVGFSSLACGSRGFLLLLFYLVSESLLCSQS
jgi:hypothetical protein